MPLVTLVNPVAVSRPLAVAGQSLESTQRLATSAPSEFDLGRFMECERGLSHVGQRGPLAGEIAGAPATSDPGYQSAALCLAFCVRVSRERRYGLLATGTAMDVRGTPWAGVFLCHYYTYARQCRGPH